MDKSEYKDALIASINKPPWEERQPKLLEYFIDSNAKTPAETDDKGNVRLRFAEIPIQGRESRTELYVKNTHDYPMQLEAVTTDPDLHIGSYPRRLLPKEIQRVVFIFSPKPDRITPLNASWDFEKTIYEE